MSKELWKAGNMLYPLPVVLVSCSYEGVDNLITIAWAGTINTNPPMVSISIRPSRYSYDIIKKSKEFVINIPTEEMSYITDFCGVKSGKDVNKFNELKIEKEKANFVKAPLVKKSPVNIECKVKEIVDLGSHSMFIAEVLGVNVDKDYIDKNNKFHFNDTKPLIYSHGEYHTINKKILGTFGYSVKKKKGRKK